MTDLEKFEDRSSDQENLPATQETQNDSMLAAIQQGYEPALIEKMMDLQERYEKKQAEKLFNKAVADFKLKPVDILKDKYNDQTKSKYVSAGQLLGAVNPALAIHGLSARFKIDDKTNKDLITVACVLSHSSGYSIEAEMSSPPDTKGPQGTANKTEIHGRMSTLTYLMKATYSAVVGVAAIDERFDTDGNSPEDKTPIDEKQLSQITAMLDDVNATKAETKKFITYLSKKAGNPVTAPITELKDIPASLFKVAEAALVAKKDEQIAADEKGDQ